MRSGDSMRWHGRKMEYRRGANNVFPCLYFWVLLYSEYKCCNVCHLCTVLFCSKSSSNFLRRNLTILYSNHQPRRIQAGTLKVTAELVILHFSKTLIIVVWRNSILHPAMLGLCRGFARFWFKMDNAHWIQPTVLFKWTFDFKKSFDGASVSHRQIWQATHFGAYFMPQNNVLLSTATMGYPYSGTG
jgi:hypothetical protein